MGTAKISEIKNKFSAPQARAFSMVKTLAALAAFSALAAVLALSALFLNRAKNNRRPNESAPAQKVAAPNDDHKVMPDPVEHLSARLQQTAAYFSDEKVFREPVKRDNLIFIKWTLPPLNDAKFAKLCFLAEFHCEHTLEEKRMEKTIAIFSQTARDFMSPRDLEAASAAIRICASNYPPRRGLRESYSDWVVGDRFKFLCSWRKPENGMAIFNIRADYLELPQRAKDDF